MIDLYNYGCIPDFEAHSLMEINRLLMLSRGGSRISREGGPNKGEGVNTCSFTDLNAGWKYKYPGLQDRGNLSVPEASTG